MTLATFFNLAVLLTFCNYALAMPVGISDEKSCTSLPAPKHGHVQMVYSTSQQLLSVFSCKKGYAPVGETIISCVNGEWNGPQPFCASTDHCDLKPEVPDKEDVLDESPKCSELNTPRFGSIDIVIGDDGQSETATFSCVPGYYVSGASALHCERGVWDGHEPECEPIDCGAPEPPTSGTVEYEDTLYRSVAHYKCDGCYQLEGIENRTCEHSGFWSKTAPKCVPSTKIACPLPFIPGGGYLPDERGLKIRGIMCGQDVTIQCFSGYRLIGTRTATCNPDGSYRWHGPTPRCQRLSWTR